MNESPLSIKFRHKYECLTIKKMENVESQISLLHTEGSKNMRII